MAEKAGLSKNQKRAIEALLSTPSVAAASRAAGLGERTLWRYLKVSAFRDELRRRQDERTAAAASALAGLSGCALETLHDLMTDPEASANVRAKCSTAWVSEWRKMHELDILTQRVSALEETLDGTRENES